MKLFFFIFSIAGATLFAIPKENCDFLLGILQNAASQSYIGEPVSQLEHALQCAHLAKEAQACDEAILAALFHDIGHLCDSPDADRSEQFGVINHSFVGADFLRAYGMSEMVCQLVLGHVQAKRYLTAKDPSYYAKLSEASKATLLLQGGPMPNAELLDFEADPLFETKIQMRFWDEQAKVPYLVVPELSAYRELLLLHETMSICSQDLIE